MKIRTKPDKLSLLKPDLLELGGHYSGKQTYLWFGYSDTGKDHRYIGTLGGRKLYRLAKAIVKQFESDKE